MPEPTTADPTNAPSPTAPSPTPAPPLARPARACGVSAQDVMLHVAFTGVEPVIDPSLRAEPRASLPKKLLGLDEPRPGDATPAANGSSQPATTSSSSPVVHPAAARRSSGRAWSPVALCAELRRSVVRQAARPQVAEFLRRLTDSTARPQTARYVHARVRDPSQQKAA